MYHSFSPLGWLTDRKAFNAQWDTNRAVAGYVWNHPLDAGGTLVKGLVSPVLDKLAHGNVGEAVGEVGGQVAFFGGVSKLVSLARGAAGLEGVAAGAEEAEGAIVSEARGGVYTLRDAAGNVVRTGRSSDLATREAALFNDPVLGRYRFSVEHRTDVYAQQRGLEQILYDRYPGARLENGGFNKIRGISPSNPNMTTYMQSAWDFLQLLGL